jgi:hypothetical protein
MKKFIFFTKEGYTYDPNHQEIHNLQILGDAIGENILEAFKNLKDNQSYLAITPYKEVMALEFIGEVIFDLEL